MQVPIDFVPQSGPVPSTSAGVLTAAEGGKPLHDQFDRVLEQLFQLLAGVNVAVTQQPAEIISRIVDTVVSLSAPQTQPETPEVVPNELSATGSAAELRSIGDMPVWKGLSGPPATVSTSIPPQALGQDSIVTGFDDAIRQERMSQTASLQASPQVEDMSVEFVDPNPQQALTFMKEQQLRSEPQSAFARMTEDNPASPLQPIYVTVSDCDTPERAPAGRHVHEGTTPQTMVAPQSIAQLTGSEGLAASTNSDPVHVSSLPTFLVGLAAQVGEGAVRQVVLRLDPPELGSITVRVRREHDSLHIDWNADSADVTRLLQLEEHRLLDRLVKCGESGGIEFTYQQDQQRQQTRDEPFEFWSEASSAHRLDRPEAKSAPEKFHNLSFVA